MLRRQSLKFPFVAANVEMDVVDLAALHSFIKLLAFDIKSRDSVLPVVDEALGKICANEPTGAQEKDLHEKLAIYDPVALQGQPFFIEDFPLSITSFR